MIDCANFTTQLNAYFTLKSALQPWEITNQLDEIIEEYVETLDSDYNIENKIAIHKSAIIESGVELKGSIVIGANSFVGANAVLSPGTILTQYSIVKRLELIEQVIYLQ